MGKGKLFFVCCTSWILAACSKPDEQSPVFQSVLLNGAVMEFHHAIAGQQNTLTVHTADDLALKQLKMEVSTVTGIHAHETTAGELPHPFMIYNQGIWDTLSIGKLSGKESTTEFSLMIPDSVSGGWDLELTILDDEGNLTSADYTLLIQNDNIPAISVGDVIPAPIDDGQFAISVGDDLTFSGYVFDPDSLEMVRVEMYNSQELVFEQEWTTIQNWSFDLSQVLLPAFSAAGNYVLHIYVSDLQGWTNHASATVIVE